MSPIPTAASKTRWPRGWFRTDQVTIDETTARVVVGETFIHFADDAYAVPGEARKLAEALVELADYAENLR
jgi:hypothetical protein